MGAFIPEYEALLVPVEDVKPIMLFVTIDEQRISKRVEECILIISDD